MQRRIATAAFLALALAAAACEKATKNSEVFQATLQGTNEVPANPSAASGACGFELAGNRVLYSIEVHGLTSILGSHIHVAPSGVNGPIRLVLLPFPGSTAVFVTSPVEADGILVSGSFGASDVTGITFDQLLNEMRNGNTYCNVHTSAFRGGEIRGQIQLLHLD